MGGGTCKRDVLAHLVLSVILGCVGTFQVYPFIGLADGFARWSMALEIARTGHILSDSLLSPVIPYIQAVTYSLTGSFGFYTLLQAVAFYLAVGFQLKILLGSKAICLKSFVIPVWNIVAAVLCIIPTIYVFPLMLTDSAPIYTLFVFGFVLCRSKIQLLLKATLGFVLVFFCVGIRINSLVLFSLLMFASLCWFVLRKEKKGLIAFLVLLTGSISGVVVPAKLMPVSYNASTLGMIWELTAIAVHDEVLQKDLAKFGDVNEAIKRFGEPYLNSIVWDRNPPFPAKKIAGSYASEVTKLYLKTFFREPLPFLRNKMHWVSSSLGGSRALISSQRGVHGVDAATRAHGALPSIWQDRLRSQFFRMTDNFNFLARYPWLAILVSVLLCALARKAGVDVRKHLGMFAVAVGYYASFCLNTQAFEFRYWAPSFFILFGVFVSLLIELGFKFLQLLVFAMFRKIETKSASDF